jgi:hypothetical protein
MSQEGTIKGSGQQDEPVRKTKAEILEEQNAALLKRLEELEKKIETNTSKSDAKELAEAIRDAVSDAVGSSGPVIANNKDKSQFSPEDYDKNGVTYFCYQYCRVMNTARVGGMEYPLPPNGPILFEYQSSLPTPGTGRESNYIILSAYTSYSKSEQEWIEGHPDFKSGVITRKMMIDADPEKIKRANRRAKFASAVNNWTPVQVAQNALNYGIQVTSDVEYMRIEIMEKMLDQEMNAEAEATRKIVAESTKEKYISSAPAGA